MIPIGSNRKLIRPIPSRRRFFAPERAGRTLVVVKRIGDQTTDSSKWVLVSGWRFDGRYSPPMLNFLDLKILTSGLPPTFNLDDIINSAEWK